MAIFCSTFFAIAFSPTHARTHCHTRTHTHTPVTHHRVIIASGLSELEFSELQKSLIHCLIGAKYDRKDDKLFFSSNVEKFVPTFENFSEAAFEAKSRTATSFFFSSVSSIPVTIEDSQPKFFLFEFCNALFARPRRIWLGRRKKDLMP